jgi:hypothetical protein
MDATAAGNVWDSFDVAVGSTRGQVTPVKHKNSAPGNNSLILRNANYHGWCSCKSIIQTTTIWKQ